MCVFLHSNLHLSLRDLAPIHSEDSERPDDFQDLREEHGEDLDPIGCVTLDNALFFLHLSFPVCTMIKLVVKLGLKLIACYPSVTGG